MTYYVFPSYKTDLNENDFQLKLTNCQRSRNPFIFIIQIVYSIPYTNGYRIPYANGYPRNRKNYGSRKKEEGSRKKEEGSRKTESPTAFKDGVTG